MAAGRKRCTTIENTDVIETEKAALKDVHAIGIFAIDPPGEIQQQLLEDPLQEDCVANSASLLLDLVNAPRGPGVNWRIHIAKRPRSEEHTSELQSRLHLVCRLLLEKKK